MAGLSLPLGGTLGHLPRRFQVAEMFFRVHSKILIMLSEISQVVKDKYHMISPLMGT